MAKMFNVSGERESNTKKSKTIYFQLITLIISDVVSEKGNNSKGSSLLIINTLFKQRATASQGIADRT